MPIKTVSIYDSDMPIDICEEILDQFSFETISNHGVKLKTQLIDYLMLEEGILMDLLFEHEEGPFKLINEYHYVPVENIVKIAIIQEKYVFMFTNYRQSEKIAFRLSNHVEGVRLYKIQFSEDVFQKVLSDNVNISSATFTGIADPNVEGSRIFGQSLQDSAEYKSYLQHGQHSYVRYSDVAKNLKVGISRKGILTFFTNLSEKQMIAYIIEKILPLMQ